MLQEGPVKPIFLPWDWPILVVPNQNDPDTAQQQFRLYYRKVNVQNKHHRFPLPIITEIYDRLEMRFCF